MPKSVERHHDHTNDDLADLLCELEDESDRDATTRGLRTLGRLARRNPNAVAGVAWA